ncbi:MAG: hypothetical protein RLZZ507_4083 [Cyanobacteriota bacterium]|jgi:hypothetical protein
MALYYIRNYLNFVWFQGIFSGLKSEFNPGVEHTKLKALMKEISSAWDALVTLVNNVLLLTSAQKLAKKITTIIRGLAYLRNNLIIK